MRSSARFLLVLSLAIWLLTSPVLNAQSISINNSGDSAHVSAILDIQSESKGMLVPRVTSDQRTSISNAATGLLVFDSETQSFWFKAASGWLELNDDVEDTLEDEDGDTKIQVEENPNDNKIRFDILGDENMVLHSNGELEVRGSNQDDPGFITLNNIDSSQFLRLFSGKATDPKPFLNWQIGSPLRFIVSNSDYSFFTEYMSIDDGRIINLGDPVEKQDAATKAYVDQVLIRFALGLPGVQGIASLLDIGFPISELINEGATLLELWNSGVTYQEFINEGITLEDLLQADVPAQALYDVGITLLELVNASLYAQDLYGLQMEGGTLYYLDVINQTGLIIGNGDIGTYSNGFQVYSGEYWGCYSTIVGASDYTTGVVNTQTIVNSGCGGVSAAIECDNYGNTYNDWYLPSIDEALLFSNLDNISNTNLIPVGLYWTSTELNATQAFAYRTDTDSFFPQDKSDGNFVRPVRKITY